MAQGKKKQQATEEKIEDTLSRGEQFFRQNAKKLVTVLAVAVVIVGAFFAYHYLLARPKAQKAAEEMYVAEQMFAEGDFALALSGDGANMGFLDIVDSYGGTKPGKLAAHYAGICYLKAGDQDSALEYLNKYKLAKGAAAAIVNAQNWGLRGDIYADRGDFGKAGDMYAKAVKAADNILTTPYFLKKSADVYAQQGDYKKALEACNRIKNEYGTSLEARDIDKYIGALEQM